MSLPGRQPSRPLQRPCFHVTGAAPQQFSASPCSRWDALTAGWRGAGQPTAYTTWLQPLQASSPEAPCPQAHHPGPAFPNNSYLPHHPDLHIPPSHVYGPCSLAHRQPAAMPSPSHFTCFPSRTHTLHGLLAFYACPPMHPPVRSVRTYPGCTTRVVMDRSLRSRASVVEMTLSAAWGCGAVR